MENSGDEALKATGFEICEFPPDSDECEECDTPFKQLYFLSHGGYDGREGSYRCLDCVIKLHKSNQEYDEYMSRMMEIILSVG